MNNRFIGNFNLDKKEIFVSDLKFYNQLKNVLRLKAKDKIIICDGKGKEAQAQIKSISKDKIVLQIEKAYLPQRDPQMKVVLYCAVLKRENFELVVQKATEIGVSKVVPIITKRTVKLSLKMERLLKIAKEAAEQSGRVFLPEIAGPVLFNESLLKNAVSENKVNYLFDINGKDNLLNNKDYLSAGVFIGPEGGWDNSEIELAVNFGFKIISLGSLTLRAETAALIGSFKVIYF
jgi:16S rRNA (uracil1498-N3)-methyltransferase